MNRTTDMFRELSGAGALIHIESHAVICTAFEIAADRIDELEAEIIRLRSANENRPTSRLPDMDQSLAEYWKERMEGIE